MANTPSSPWRPLRERQAGLTDERPLVDGVPDYLLSPLQNWLEVALDESLEVMVALKLRRPTGDPDLDDRVYIGALQGDDLLEMLDAVLHEQRHLLDSTLR